jgi:hypothetical protein
MCSVKDTSVKDPSVKDPSVKDPSVKTIPVLIRSYLPSSFSEPILKV